MDKKYVETFTILWYAVRYIIRTISESESGARRISPAYSKRVTYSDTFVRT